MNKYQEALGIYDEIIKRVNHYGRYTLIEEELEPLINRFNTLQELVDKAPYYKELEDKATPKKPNKLTYKLLLDDGWKYECPRCKCAIGINPNALDYTQDESFCPTCSQAIDWSKDE